MMWLIIGAWLACAAGTFALLWPALAAGKRADEAAEAPRPALSLVRALRPPRLADITDAREPWAWDGIAGTEPWRGMLSDARMRDHTNRRKAA